MLRRINTILSICLIVIFMIHGVLGGFMLLEVGHTALKTMAWIGVDLLCVHVLIGVILTIDTFRNRKTAGGDGYRAENSLFWTRRASGLAILLLMFFHFGMFGEEKYGQFILLEFTTVKLIIMILFVLALFVHIFVNVRPLLVSMGVLKYKERKIDIFLILSILLLFICAAIVVYYIRWQF